MTNRLDPTFVRMQIEALRIAFPEIWDDGDEALLADMLEAQTDLHEFLAAVVVRMLDAKKFRDGIGELIHGLGARARRYDQRYEAMRSLAFKVMQAAEVRKVELLQATLSIRAGQPKVIITNEKLLPRNCVRVKYEPDKIRIKELLSRGDEVAGAEMSNAEPVLNVRI